MTKLYKLNYAELKLEPLGHVHVGNIFVVEAEGEEGEMCLLGGYENTLLKYRTRFYNAIYHYSQLPSIDVIMFGECVDGWVWLESCDSWICVNRSCGL